MNNKEKIDIHSIAKHVAVLNSEVGDLKLDVDKIENRLIKLNRVVYYIAGILSLAAGKVVFFT